MGIIRYGKEKGYDRLIDDAEKILCDGGMGSSYAPKFISALASGKGDDVIGKNVSEMLKTGGFGKAARLFMHEEKYGIRSHCDLVEIGDINKEVLGSALEKIREYVISMRFRK